ncbi:hypothetical protein SBADM41S_01019 [Streptomyces badius]
MTFQPASRPRTAGPRRDAAGTRRRAPGTPGHLGGRAGLALELVDAVLVELGRGDVERERDVAARDITGLLDGLDDEVQGGAVGLQVRGEAALVAESGGQALGFEDLLQRVVDLRAPAQGLGEGLRADRRDHELLDVHVGVGVRAAVQDVHHRNGQQVRVRAAQVAEERQVGRLGGGVRDGQRDAEDGVRAERGLVLGGVQVEHRLVDEALLGGVVPDQLRADLLDDGVGRPSRRPCPGSGWGHRREARWPRTHRWRRRTGTAARPVLLFSSRPTSTDRGVPPGVEDFPCYDDVDGRHEASPSGDLTLVVQGHCGLATRSLSGPAASVGRPPASWGRKRTRGPA